MLIRSFFIVLLLHSGLLFAQPTCPTLLTFLDVQKAAQKGITIVTLPPKPKTKSQIVAEELLYGAKVLHSGRNKNINTQYLNGVVIHISDEASVARSYKGKVNLTLDAAFTEILIDNKWNEYEFINTVAPGIMAPSINAEVLINNNAFIQLQAAVLELVNNFVYSNRKSFNQNEKQSIEKLVDLFLIASKNHFPKGAFIKNVSEQQTGDKQDQITTFKSSSPNITKEFINAVIKTKKEIGAKSYSSAVFQNHLLYEMNSSTSLVNSLLLNPRRVMVQERLDLALSPVDGLPLEIRVDFASGIVLNTTTRFTHAYIPQELEKAENFMRSFFDKLPAPYKKISGGADVVILNDGTVRVIEWNFGRASSYISASDLPISANIFISDLQGKPTPLLEGLEKLFASDLKIQREVLKSLNPKYEIDKKNVQDLSVEEVALWLRDRYLIEWEKDPSPEKAQKYIRHLRLLLQHKNKSTQKELDLIFKGAEHYLTT